MDSDGILKACTTKVRMNRARMIAVQMDSKYSLQMVRLSVAPVSFCSISLLMWCVRPNEMRLETIRRTHDAAATVAMARQISLKL